MVFEEVRWIPARNVTLVTYRRILWCGGGSSNGIGSEPSCNLTNRVYLNFYLPGAQHRHRCCIVLFIQVDFFIRAPSSTLSDSIDLKQH